MPARGQPPCRRAPLAACLLALAASGAGAREARRASSGAVADAPAATADPPPAGNTSGPAPPGAEACLWQGDARGCGAVRDEGLCLRSVDGRPWRQWRGHLVHGQPCAWCGGDSCLEGDTALCAPADWVRGRLRVTVGSCSAAAPSEWPAPGFACTARGAAASSSVNHFYYTFTAGSLDDCKRLCSSEGYCRAIEYQALDAKCLLWWHPVESVEPRPGHTCAIVRGAELVELHSTEMLASISAEAPAPALAKLNLTEVAAPASDPSTTEGQELLGEVGSTSDPSTTEGQELLGEVGSTSDPSTTEGQELLGEVGSTSDPSTTEGQELLGEVGSTSDPSTTEDQDLGEEGSTSAEAEGGFEVVLMPSDTPGAQQSFCSGPACWALAGAALCAGVAACAAPLLWHACRAPRRTTRAAELQRAADLQDEHWDFEDFGTGSSDDFGSAPAAAAASEPGALEPLGAAAGAAPLPVLLGPAAARRPGPFEGLKRAAAPGGAYAPLAPGGAPPRWAAVGGPLPPTPPPTPRQPAPRLAAPAVDPPAAGPLLLTPRQLAPATPLLAPRPAAPAPRQLAPHAGAQPARRALAEPAAVQRPIA